MLRAAMANICSEIHIWCVLYSFPYVKLSRLTNGGKETAKTIQNGRTNGEKKKSTDTRIPDDQTPPPTPPLPPHMDKKVPPRGS